MMSPMDVCFAVIGGGNGGLAMAGYLAYRGFSVAATLAIHFPSYSIVSYFLAVMVGVSRVYTGMHYPSDVLSGAFLGMGFAILTSSFKTYVYILKFCIRSFISIYSSF
jgi:hypothetical protein